ncbi:hypothetical protein J5893_06355 [bacterium]|nr:hypothetical protein [bacterium]
MKKTLYGLLLGIMTVFGVATVLPVAAQDYDSVDPTRVDARGIGGHSEGL